MRNILIIFLVLISVIGCEKGKDNLGDPMLFKAVKDGDTGRVRELLRGGISVQGLDQWGYNVLRYVRDEEIAVLLLKKGANPNHISPLDPDQQTPLHYLCISSDVSVKVIEQLVAAGSNTTTKDFHGKTPVDYMNQAVKDFPSEENYKAKLEILMAGKKSKGEKKDLH